jgi:pyridoxine kinase
LPIVPVGTGDLFTGLLTANLAHGHALVEATRDAASVVLDVLGRTIAEGEHEMQLGSVIDALLSMRTENIQ